MRKTEQAIQDFCDSRGPKAGHIQAITVTESSKAFRVAAPGQNVLIDVPSDGSTLFYVWGEPGDAIDEGAVGTGADVCACLPAGCRTAETTNGSCLIAKVAKGEDPMIVRISGVV